MKQIFESERISFVEASELLAKNYLILMIEKASGDFIGNVELRDVCGEVAEFGIDITTAKQDKGFGTEAVAAVTEYGLERFGLKRIFLRTNPINARAIHVYEKCGFREYDRDEKHVYMEIVR